MHKILRLALTLFVVGVVSALVLTGVYRWTEPIIAQRQLADYLKAVEEYFPNVADYQTEEVDGNSYDLVYDDSGALLGVVGTIQQVGYDGVITFNLAVDIDGKIVGLRIISHSETPGIGDAIERQDFREQFLGKDYEAPLQPGDDVEIVTGATVSTNAIIGSVRRVVSTIAFTFMEFEEDIFDIAQVADGIYEGTAKGFIGEITVSVTVEDGKITVIEVIDNSETSTYFVEAYPLIPERIIEEQALEVDAQTGATGSAEGIINAVRNALEKGIEGGGEEE